MNYNVTFRKQKFCDFDVNRERTQKWRASDVPHDAQILDAFEHIHQLLLAVICTVPTPANLTGKVKSCNQALLDKPNGF